MMPPRLEILAAQAREIVGRARAAGVVVDDGNVVDLLADHMTRIPLETLRHVLVVAGFGDEFPRASTLRGVSTLPEPVYSEDSPGCHVPWCPCLHCQADRAGVQS